MSAPNSLSSLSGSGSSYHPIWPTTTILSSSANNPAAASSGILPSPTFLMRNNRQNHSSLPTYTRLGDDGVNHDGDSNHPNQGQQSEQPANHQQQELATTYSTPQAASAAYNSGLLKSDYNISSNALRIRLAFRYHYLMSQLQHVDDEQKNDAKSESGGEHHDDKTDDDLLYLCWIRQDGIPCHFRKLAPVKKNNGGNKGNEESAPATKSLRGGGNTKTTAQDDDNGDSDDLFVNDHDVIENTFPGHAFIFCRRIANNYNHHNRIGDDINSSLRVVQDDNGHTKFLRRMKQRNDEVKSDKSSSSSSSSSEKDEEKLQEEGKGANNDDENYTDDEWEAYLVVGGFRPGPMPIISSPTVVENEVEESSRNVDSDEERSTHDDEDNSDDDSDDEMELQVQLVTIRRSKMLMRTDNKQDHATTTTSLRGAAQSETSVVDASKSSSQLEQAIDDLKVTVRLAQIDPTPVDMSSKHYDQVTLGGWPCRIEPGCFDSCEKNSSENGQRSSLQSRFETDITAACQSLPPMAREKLQQSTPIWINKSHMWGPRVAPIRGRDACFHPGAQWLSRNGDNPLKCGGVEFYDAKHYLSDCDHWGPGGLILHELCHAWHNIHITNGYDNEQIKECYDLAMKDGLYDCVRVHGPQGPECKAYACTNPMEYFAELSVACLGGLDDTLEHNKWFPFNRRQLREHDPRAFDLLCHMWGVAVVDDDAETLIHSERGEESKET